MLHKATNIKQNLNVHKTYRNDTMCKKKKYIQTTTCYYYIWGNEQNEISVSLVTVQKTDHLNK